MSVSLWICATWTSGTDVSPPTGQLALPTRMFTTRTRCLQNSFHTRIVGKDTHVMTVDRHESDSLPKPQLESRGLLWRIASTVETENGSHIHQGELFPSSARCERTPPSPIALASVSRIKSWLKSGYTRIGDSNQSLFEKQKYLLALRKPLERLSEVVQRLRNPGKVLHKPSVVRSQP